MVIIIKYNAHPVTSSLPHNSLLSRFLRTNASPPLLKIKMEMLITDDQGYEQEDKDVDEEKDDLSMTLKTKMSFR